MYIFKNNTYQSITGGSRGKLSTLQITNQYCKAEISLFGAHLLSFVPSVDNIDRLWVSSSAIFDKSKPIRGGIPVCWPWFGPMYPYSITQNSAPAPAHGFVRTQDWQIVEITEVGINKSIQETRIVLQPSQLGLYEFSEHLSVRLEVTFAEKCTIRLITVNNGDDNVQITAALHSYFNIVDIRRTKIVNISGKYIDQTNDGELVEQALPYLISNETDRIHLKDECNQFDNIELYGAETRINITQAGHDSVVVWNPWNDKSKSMPDMGAEAYLDMLCIEASITQGLDVKPKQQHVLMQVIT
jgi:glucose-6-phosphate 1-epimerase